MGNSTWVCFQCREAVRRPTQGTHQVTCSRCGGECTNLGYKIETPKKRDGEAWTRLAENLHDQTWRQLLSRQAASVSERHAHALEQEISELQQREANPGRQELIRSLQTKLEQARKRMT